MKFKFVGFLVLILILFTSVLVSCSEADPEHSCGDWTVTLEPTCRSNGERERECKLCGHKEKDVLFAVDHSYGINNKCIWCDVEKGSYSLKYELSADGGSYSVVGCGLNEEELFIPSSYNGKPVLAIAKDAFSRNTKIKTVFLHSGIKTIEENAFADCISLVCVTLPDTIDSIETDAFKGCLNLIEVRDFSSLDVNVGETKNGRVAENAFSVRHDFDTGIVNENGFLFFTHGNDSLLVGYIGKDTDLLLPDGYNGASYGIMPYAFSSYPITSVKIEGGVSIVGENAFSSCLRLTSLSLKAGELTLGASALEGCVELETVILDAGIKLIPDNAFNGCASLVSITLPDTVEKIGNSAFRWCASLEKIDIPERVLSIEDLAFDGCTSLSALTMAGNVRTIGMYSFFSCSSLESVVLSAALTDIGDFAFSECTSLSSVTLPSALAKIGFYAFSKCEALSNIGYADSELKWNGIIKGTGWDKDTGSYSVIFNFSDK